MMTMRELVSWHERRIRPWCGRSVERSRDRIFDAFGNLAVARIRVYLTKGEINCIPQITRSVICFDTCAQSLSTDIRDVCRAFEQTDATPNAHLDRSEKNSKA